MNTGTPQNQNFFSLKLGVKYVTDCKRFKIGTGLSVKYK